jgi:hypothetical protein
MAAKTRRFAAMSTEPAQPDTAPRPKGFVRRNWGALSILACALPFMFLSIRLEWADRPRGYRFVVKNGNIEFWSTHDFMLSGRFQFEIQPPRLGRLMPYDMDKDLFSEKGTTGMRYGVAGSGFPVWWFLALPALWIVGGEGQRKGKACQQ